MLKRIKVDKDVERKIATAFIVSDLFCKKVKNIYKPEYIEVDYARRVVGWALEYFDQYDKAPGVHIQEVFDIEEELLQEAEAELIGTFLIDISDEFQKTEVINVDYWVDQAKDYFRKRSLEILFETGNKLTSIGRVDEAERLLLDHTKVAKLTSGRFNPFDISVVRQHQYSSDANQLFRLPGAVGDLLGWFERGWLVAVTAPEKRGKSWFLEEMAFSALTNKLKVFWVTLEMTQNTIEKRIYQRLTTCDTTKESRDCIYPVFDCSWNQHNSCNKKVRECNEGVYEGLVLKKYKDVSTYKVCTKCRGNNNDYSPAYWYKNTKTTPIKTRIIEKKVIGFTSMFGSNFRVKSFPRFSATMDDVMDELDDLQYSEGFYPDVVLIDYLDILMHSNKYSDGRDRTNTTWMMGSRISGEKNCLVITADQSDAAGRDKRSLSSINFSEDKRKDAHLDVRIAINQVPIEHEDKVARLSMVFHRHNECIVGREVMILQELSLGQPILDSEPWIKRYDRWGKKDE